VQQNEFLISLDIDPIRTGILGESTVIAVLSFWDCGEGIELGSMCSISLGVY
jgi:hypothetical protein